MFLIPESSYSASVAIDSGELRYCVPRERMIAIQYCKVKFAKYWSKRVDTAFLDLARWENF